MPSCTSADCLVPTAYAVKHPPFVSTTVCPVSVSGIHAGFSASSLAVSDQMPLEAATKKSAHGHRPIGGWMCGGVAMSSAHIYNSFQCCAIYMAVSIGPHTANWCCCLPRYGAVGGGHLTPCASQRVHCVFLSSDPDLYPCTAPKRLRKLCSLPPVPFAAPVGRRSGPLGRLR